MIARTYREMHLALAPGLGSKRRDSVRAVILLLEISQQADGLRATYTMTFADPRTGLGGLNQLRCRGGLLGLHADQPMFGIASGGQGEASQSFLENCDSILVKNEL